MCLEIFFQENFLRSSIVWNFIWNHNPFFQDLKCTFEIIFQENFLNYWIVWNLICNYTFSFQNLKYAFEIFFKQNYFEVFRLCEISFGTTPPLFKTSMQWKHFSQKHYLRSSIDWNFLWGLYLFFSRFWMYFRNKIWSLQLFEILFGITPLLSRPQMCTKNKFWGLQLFEISLAIRPLLFKTSNVF